MPPSRLECGNPLLRDWVGEWMEEAKAMQMKSFFSYKKAHDSLSRCPMVFSHPCEAEQLNGIGPTLVKRLEQKMIQYCQDNGLPTPIRPKGKKRGHSQNTSTSTTASPSDSTESSTKRKRAPRPYIPRYRTGSYAILLCLLDFKEQGQHNALKEEIINKGQVYCDVSMDLAEPGQNYTAWSGIKILKEKGYVWQNGSPARFMLTESGETLALQLRNASDGNQEHSTATTSTSVSSTNALRSSSTNKTSKSRNYSSGLQSVWDEFMESQNNNNNNNEVDLSLYVLNPSERQLVSNSNMPATTTQLPNYSQQNNTNTNNISSSSQISFSQVDNYNYNDFDLTDDSDDINLCDIDPASISNSNINNHISVSKITTNNTQKQKQKVHINSNNNSIINNNSSNNYNLIVNNHNNRYNNTINNYSNSSNNCINPNNNYINLEEDDHGSQSSILLLPSSSKNDKSVSSTSSLPLPSTCQPEVITLLSPSPPPSSPIIQPISNQQESSNQSLFQYTYLDINDKQVRHLSQASVKIDHISHTLLYKIQFSSHQKYHSKVQQLKYVDESTCTGYIYEMVADLICSGLPPKPLLPLHEENQNSQLSVSSQTTNNNSFWPLDSQDMISSQPTIHNDSDDDYGWNTQSSYNDNGNNTNILSSSPSLYQLNRSDRSDYDDMNNTQYTTNSETVDTTITTTIDYVSAVKRDGQIWLPEEYTIMMVLDNREVKMKTNREYIQDTLCQKGVHVMKRALDLGDVIWVARHKTTNEEMFLDIVVERKRLDDLVSSVKDGRYHEQKFRLKHSGSRKVIYIIEEYNREEINKYSGQQIRTSMSSVQAVDQFYLKRTNSLEETIDYLVCVTKMVERLYQNVKLQEIPPRLVTKENYIEIKRQLHEDNKQQQQTNNIKSNLYHVISYSLYNQLNSKSGSSTLQDLYMKMLMTIRGVSAEKAYALVQYYPTPHQLLVAMDSLTVIEGKKLAMDATKDNLQRRRWTAQLSERLWNIWGQLSSS